MWIWKHPWWWVRSCPSYFKNTTGWFDTSFPKAYREIYDKEKMVLNSLLDQFLILNIYKQHPPYLKAKTKITIKYYLHSKSQCSRNICLPVWTIEHECPSKTTKKHPVRICTKLHCNTSSKNHKNCRRKMKMKTEWHL